LVIAQNPGEIHDEPWRLLLAKEMAEAAECKRAITLCQLYHLDFRSSNAYNSIAKVFGQDWLETWLYTNAVRCRTVHNEAPDDDMISACATWTRMLATDRKLKGIVFLGAVAVKQMLGDDAKILGIGSLKRHPKSRVVMLALPHFVKWQANELDNYRDLIKKMMEAK
jgi:uracil-DNA glycosylase